MVHSPPDTFCGICILETVSRRCWDTHFPSMLRPAFSPRSGVRIAIGGTLRPLLTSPTSGPGSRARAALASVPALPMATVEQPARSTAVHSIRPVDTNGRVVDKAIVEALDRRPGDLLSWRVHTFVF